MPNLLCKLRQNKLSGKRSTLNAGNFEVFKATRSYDTSLERSHQFLKDKEVYKGIAVKLGML